ncbi:MAG: hypothetical protein RLZZ175_706 [Bacteroidota bacterium]
MRKTLLQSHSNSIINMNSNNRYGVAIAGLFLLIIGSVLFAEKLGVVFPSCIFTWQMMLIVLGIFIAIKKRCRGGSWIFLTVTGIVFMIDDLYPELNLFSYAGAVSIIILGILLIIKSLNKPKEKNKKELADNESDDNPEYSYDYSNGKPWEKSCFSNKIKSETSSNDYLEITTLMSGVRKNIISKNFKGGEITSFMGGCEINFLHADFNGTITIDITQTVGGLKLIVPSNWVIQSKITSVMGGLQDRRPNGVGTQNPDKVLILTGTNLMGGIDIISY